MCIRDRADVAREYVGVVGKLWLQKSGIGQIRGKMQMAAGKMRTEKQFSKENEKQNGQEGLNKQQRRSCQKEKIPENKENDRKANIHKKELLSLMLYEPWILSLIHICMDRRLPMGRLQKSWRRCRMRPICPRRR